MQVNNIEITECQVLTHHDSGREEGALSVLHSVDDGAASALPAFCLRDRPLPFELSTIFEELAAEEDGEMAHVKAGDEARLSERTGNEEGVSRLTEYFSAFASLSLVNDSSFADSGQDSPRISRDTSLDSATTFGSGADHVKGSATGAVDYIWPGDVEKLREICQVPAKIDLDWHCGMKKTDGGNSAMPVEVSLRAFVALASIIKRCPGVIAFPEVQAYLRTTKEAYLQGCSKPMADTIKAKMRTASQFTLSHPLPSAKGKHELLLSSTMVGQAVMEFVEAAERVARAV